MKLKPGIHKGLSYDEYASIPACSRGDISPNRSWLHSRYAALADNKPTEALDYGRALHTAILEPGLLDKQFYFAELYNYTTKEGKAKREIDAQTAGARTVIRGILPLAWAGTLKKFAPCTDALVDAQVELTIVWESGGVLCKGRADIWQPSTGLLADIKTTTDASLRGMQKAILSFGYHYQMAWYRWGMRQCGLAVKDVQIIAVEKEAPFACACYTLDPVSLDRAERIMRQRLKQYSQLLGRDDWPAYPNTPQLMSLPGWAFDEAEEGIEAGV
jgi:hypothetical protein